MINDRKILISVGNHRRSVNWQPQTLLLSCLLYTSDAADE